MKKIILGFLILVITLSANAQQNQKEFYELKVERYSKMKRNGITMGAIGGAATAIGIILMEQAEWTKTTTATMMRSSNSSESNNSSRVSINIHSF